ncbi:aspartyl protease family protein [bacterium SCSIO 12643]|nr:aspartyl protease family protein [bacterium SCSIO 12643]
MRLYITIAYTLSLLSFSSCGVLSAFKIQKAKQNEHMGKSQYYQELPFKIVNGLIVIPVNISGTEKNFIFDTGAHTILDQNLLSQISYQKLGKTKTFDSNGQRRFLQTIQIDQLHIGQIPFYDVVATTTDLQLLSKLSCIDISGIIGINIMNKGIWQIDYSKSAIIFTDQPNLLPSSSEADTIPFQSDIQGYPTLSIHMDSSFIDQGLLDTGFNGSIVLSQQHQPDHIPFVTQFNYAYALHGQTAAEQKIISYPIQLNGITIDSNIINFSDQNTKVLIGNRFLRDYRTTLNWENHFIVLDKIKDDSVSLSNYGFYPTSKQDKIVIGSIYDSSELFKKGVRLGDQILKFNGINLQQNGATKLCDVLEELKNKHVKISLTVLHANQVLEFELSKLDHLQALKP